MPRTRSRHLTAPQATLAASLCLVLTAGGCSRGLFDDEHALLRLPKERLRDVERRSLTPYIKQRQAESPSPTLAQQHEAASSRFANVESVEMDLERCRQSALTNNLDLRIARIAPSIESARVSEEEARFNAAFTLSAQTADFNQPTASTLVAAQSQTTRVTPGVRIPLRTGGTVSVDLPWNRNSDNNAFSTLNPSFATDFQFSISQPLLRNAGRRANTSSLRIAAFDEQSAEARTKLEVIRQLAAVDRSYWRLYSARKQLEVRQQQYELAMEQLARAERRVRAELSTEIEVVRAQAGVAERLEGIILAQNDVLTQQRELKRIINEPGLTMSTTTVLVPSSQPDPVEYEFDREKLIAEALSNRMEMLDLELQLAADAARIAFSRNQALPLLSLDYTYRLNGLGGSTQDAFKQLRDDDFQDWALGLSAEIPLDNEQARSRIRQAVLLRQQRLASKDARALSITQEVLASIDQLDATWQRILAARQSVVLNTRSLQAEQRQFDVGNSTSTDVLDAAARLADAQLAEIRAIADYQIAQVDLSFATGTLLGASKVSFEAEPQPDLDRPDPAESVEGAQRVDR